MTIYAECVPRLRRVRALSELRAVFLKPYNAALDAGHAQIDGCSTPIVPVCNRSGFRISLTLQMLFDSDHVVAKILQGLSKRGQSKDRVIRAEFMSRNCLQGFKQAFRYGSVVFKAQCQIIKSAIVKDRADAFGEFFDRFSQRYDLIVCSRTGQLLRFPHRVKGGSRLSLPQKVSDENSCDRTYSLNPRGPFTSIEPVASTYRYQGSHSANNEKCRAYGRSAARRANGCHLGILS